MGDRLYANLVGLRCRLRFMRGDFERNRTNFEETDRGLSDLYVRKILDYLLIGCNTLSINYDVTPVLPGKLSPFFVVVFFLYKKHWSCSDWYGGEITRFRYGRRVTVDAHTTLVRYLKISLTVVP